MGSRPLDHAIAYAELIERAVTFARGEHYVWMQEHRATKHPEGCTDPRPRCIRCGQHRNDGELRPGSIGRNCVQDCRPFDMRFEAVR